MYVCGLETKREVEKMKKLYNILKEICYYLHVSTLEFLNMPKHMIMSLIYTTLVRLHVERSNFFLMLQLYHKKYLEILISSSCA